VVHLNVYKHIYKVVEYNTTLIAYTNLTLYHLLYNVTLQLEVCGGHARLIHPVNASIRHIANIFMPPGLLLQRR
jgi:hypothetical protein